MIILKKLLISTTTLTLLVLLSAGGVFAQQGVQIQDRDRDEIGVPDDTLRARERMGDDASDETVLQMDAQEAVEAEDGNEGGSGTGKQTGNQQLRKAEDALEQVRETVRTNNPETGAQVQQMIENQQKVRIRVEKNMDVIKDKPAILKFFFGADYQTAGEVKGEMIQLKNQVSQMEQLKEQFGNASEETVEMVDEAIESMETGITLLEAELEEQVSGFSLLGWLNKALANY